MRCESNLFTFSFLRFFLRFLFSHGVLLSRDPFQVFDLKKSLFELYTRKNEFMEVVFIVAALLT